MRMMSKRFRFLLRLRARYNLFALMNIDTFDSSMPSTSAPQMLPTEASATRRRGPSMPPDDHPLAAEAMLLDQDHSDISPSVYTTSPLRPTTSPQISRPPRTGRRQQTKTTINSTIIIRSLSDSRNDQHHIQENQTSLDNDYYSHSPRCP